MKLASQCLARVRASIGLIDFCVRVNPYHQDYAHLRTMLDKLQNQQTDISKLVIQRRQPPQLLTCNPLGLASIGMGQLLSEDLSNDCLILQLIQNQQWSNNMIRELNQQSIQQKQIREVLIKFRNTLQQYTLPKQLKSSPARLLKYIL